MRKKLLVLLVAAGSLLPAQVSIGIRIGNPPPMRVERVRPRQPGPDYVWIPGYWYPQGRKYKWHAGYWTVMPYRGARWAAPRYDGGMYYPGFWEGDRGRFDHDHRWDRDRRNRDRDRYDRRP